MESHLEAQLKIRSRDEGLGNFGRLCNEGAFLPAPKVSHVHHLLVMMALKAKFTWKMQKPSQRSKSSLEYLFLI